MKRLQEFINEQFEKVEESKSTEKSFTFDLKDTENAEETLESFKDIEGVTVEETKVTVKVSEENKDKLGTFQDIMQQFVAKIRSSQKVASDEQYAQLTKKLEDKLNEFNVYLDELEKPADNKDDKKECDKDDKKECDKEDKQE